MTGEFLWSADKIEKLRERVHTLPAVLPILQDPRLASLLSCRGIQFELNTPMNRLTEFITTTSELPWLSRILSTQAGYKIEIYLQDDSEFRILKEDIAVLISPESLDLKKRLTKIVIDPIRIACMLKFKGVELVIVRDWILASGLASDPKNAVYYAQANPWEFKNNVGYRQCEMMSRHQLPFFGTHDLADHVAGSSRDGLEKSHHFVLTTFQLMQEKFSKPVPDVCDLTYSYLLSLLLDDLAQPRWHGNAFHEQMLEYITQKWIDEDTSNICADTFNYQIPEQFAEIMRHLRSAQTVSDLGVVREQIDQINHVWMGEQSAS